MNQARSSKEIAMKNDADTAVICCDFAEKFKCIQQNATQSAYYGQTPVSLFAVAVYHRGMNSLVLASDCEKNTKECVLAYIETIMRELPTTVKFTNIWSDNGTSQFKNQFIMEGMKSFEQRFKPMKIRWHFYAAIHEKSVVDGIGGNVKRFVRRKIVSGYEDFVKIASTMDIQVKLLKIAYRSDRYVSTK